MNIRRIIGVAKIFWKRHGAKILTGAGIAGFGATTVLACKATLQIEPVVDRAKQDISAAKECTDEAERAQKARDKQVQQITKTLGDIGREAGKQILRGLFGTRR